MVRRFAVMAVACAALACGGEGQDPAEEAAGSAALATCYGTYCTAPWDAAAGCPSGYTRWGDQLCVKCQVTDAVVTGDGCDGGYGGAASGVYTYCAIPTPRAILCAGKTGQVYDHATCLYVDCTGCTDAAQTSCNGTCTNLKTDEKNCGACGHECQGYAGGRFPAYCSYGQCRTCTFTRGYGGTAGSWLCDRPGPVCTTGGYGGPICTCAGYGGGSCI